LIAARDAGASCSRFGNFVMALAASRKVVSVPPSGSGIGARAVPGRLAASFSLC